MSIKKMIPGVLAVAGLMTACGGEVREPINEPGDTSLIESKATVYHTTSMGESVPCDTASAITYYNPAPYTLSTCWLAASFTHQYNNTGYVTAKPGTYIVVGANGLIGSVYLSGNQSLYVGVGNGSVEFKSDMVANLTTTSLAEGRAHFGILPGDTCLWQTSTSKIMCKGSEGAHFNAAGYVSNCQSLGPCSP